MKADYADDADGYLMFFVSVNCNICNNITRTSKIRSPVISAIVNQQKSGKVFVSQMLRDCADDADVYLLIFE